MENKNQKCENCKNYRAFYVKSTNSFVKLDFGICKTKKLQTEKDGYCENWQAIFRRTFVTSGFALKKLSEAADNIALLKQFLMENK